MYLFQNNKQLEDKDPRHVRAHLHTRALYLYSAHNGRGPGGGYARREEASLSSATMPCPRARMAPALSQLARGVSLFARAAAARGCWFGFPPWPLSA